MKNFLLFIFFILISINSSVAVDYSQFDLKDINSVNNAVKVYQEEYKDRKGTKETEDEYNKFLEFYNNNTNTQVNKKHFTNDSLTSGSLSTNQVHSETAIQEFTNSGKTSELTVTLITL